jgi:hypothetical protein
MNLGMERMENGVAASAATLLRHFCRGPRIGLILLCLGFLTPVAQAQLAQNFINVTAITTKKLPNAVQIRIETDGTPQFGTDMSDFVDFDAGFIPKATQSLRIRILQARSKLPGFVPVDAYPVDGAVVTLGSESMTNPDFSDGSNGDSDPRVEVELRFANPTLIRRFSSANYHDVNFGNYLGPLEARVEQSPDRRAILITVITDRADATAPQRMDRSPSGARHHTLTLAALEAGHFKLQTLHTPLRDVMAQLGGQIGTNFLVRDEIALLDISLTLPDTTLPDLLEALQIGYGVGSRDENGTTVLSRGDEFFASKSFPLQNLLPEKARLLYPDFLLPFLRADDENHALLAVQTPAVLAKIGADLALLDRPRAQFEIKVEAWEIADTRDYNATLALTRGVGADIEAIDILDSTTSVQVNSGSKARISATLNALSEKGRARLMASPRVTALSGEQGTLFLGQTRYIKILQNQFGGQTAKAQALQIGTTLNVTPLGNDTDGDVMLSVAPSVSTVDEIEAITGLPTVGIRQISSQVLSKPGECVVLAGLDLESSSKTRGKTLRILPSKRESHENQRLLVLLTVQRITT